MDNLVGILLGVFVLCILGASHFTRTALRSLGESHRSELVRISANWSMLNLAVPIIVAITYVLVVMNARELLPTATVGALGILLVHGIVSAWLADRSYRAAQMPPRFMKYFRLARGTRILGAAMLFTGVLIWVLFSSPLANSHTPPVAG